MKKRLLLVFIISFMSITLIIVLFNELKNRKKVVKFEDSLISLQEYRSDEETVNLFIDSYMRNNFMLINNPSCDFTYIKPMLDDSIEQEVIQNINYLRNKEVKVDYNFEIKSTKKEGDIYDYILNVYGLRFEDEKEIKENYNLELKIKKVKDRLKVIYENRV